MENLPLLQFFETATSVTHTYRQTRAPSINTGTHHFHRQFLPFTNHTRFPRIDTAINFIIDLLFQDSPYRIIQRIQIGARRRPFLGLDEIGTFGFAPSLCRLGLVGGGRILLKAPIVVALYGGAHILRTPSKISFS